MTERTFPHDDALCEACGYPLQGLSLQGDCPECGKAIAESSPARRVGLPWQRRKSVGAWLATTSVLMRRPSEAYAVMRLDCGTGHALAYAGVMVALLSVVWLVLAPMPLTYRLLLPVTLVVGLSLIEAGGVAMFSKRHKYRVPLGHSVQVACFALVGWLPFVVVMPGLYAFGVVAWIRSIWPAEVLGELGGIRMLLIVMLFGGVAVLWFETLVWLGVKQTRYGNQWQTAAPEEAANLNVADKAAT